MPPLAQPSPASPLTVRPPPRRPPGDAPGPGGARGRSGAVPGTVTVTVAAPAGPPWLWAERCAAFSADLWLAAPPPSPAFAAAAVSRRWWRQDELRLAAASMAAAASSCTRVVPRPARAAPAYLQRHATRRRFSSACRQPAALQCRRHSSPLLRGFLQSCPPVATPSGPAVRVSDGKWWSSRRRRRKSQEEEEVEQLKARRKPAAQLQPPPRSSPRPLFAAAAATAIKEAAVTQVADAATTKEVTATQATAAALTSPPVASAQATLAAETTLTSATQDTQPPAEGATAITAAEEAVPPSTKMDLPSSPEESLPIPSIKQAQAAGSLLAFNAAVRDPRGYLANWVGATPCACSWTGVFCKDQMSGRYRCPSGGLSIWGPHRAAVVRTQLVVTGLDLNGFGLRGYVPRFLRNIMDFIHASQNFFIGTLPDLSALTLLTEIDFSLNILSGPLPLWVTTLPALRFLDLRFNSFTGTLPPSLFRTSQEVLAVNDNIMTQRIPDSL
eukprot:SM000016S01958  [mRNA]  locus=s16:904866:907395:+ [translate_table: standard]